MNTQTSNLNFLQNLPAIQGVDSALIYNNVLNIFGDLYYRTRVSELASTMLYQNQGAASASTDTASLVDDAYVNLIAQEAIRCGTALALGFTNFDWSSVSGAGTQGAGQVQRRTA